MGPSIPAKGRVAARRSFHRRIPFQLPPRNRDEPHLLHRGAWDGAGLAAELAAGDGVPRVYVVEPTGEFENDPNVTDKKFPGNPTRSYRSRAPLRIVGEVTDWTRLTPEALQMWRDRLAAGRLDGSADIIN